MSPLEPILKFFVSGHLPSHLKEIAEIFEATANDMVNLVPGSAEATAGMRKLLEAKDCFVRAGIK